jgi:TfoX/Sxy family transcriptional regulator of competence genes
VKTKWKKSPPALVAAFDAAMARDPRIVRRQMFGYPCAFLNGNMLSGLFEDQMMVRLGEADRARATLTAAATPFAPAGRPMREYVVLPPEVTADARRLGAWLNRAIAYVDAMPAKKPKSRPKARRGS